MDARGGYYKDEAISLLQQFYKRGNPRAPKPHRPVQPRSDRVFEKYKTENQHTHKDCKLWHTHHEAKALWWWWKICKMICFVTLSTITHLEIVLALQAAAFLGRVCLMIIIRSMHHNWWLFSEITNDDEVAGVPFFFLFFLIFIYITLVFAFISIFHVLFQKQNLALTTLIIIII